MLGIAELKENIEITAATVECPVKGCNEKVKRQRVTFKKEERFKCPMHNIYISPSTFEYPSDLDNLLWKEKADLDLFEGIKRVKRERRIARDNSEDAVSWNVFRFLERNNLVGDFLKEICNSPVINPEVIYWSYSQSQQRAWDELLKAKVEFGEATNARAAIARGSEPDLIVKSEAALFFIEAKLRSTNKTPSPTNPKVQTNYVKGGTNWWNQVFRSDFETVAIDAKKYELSRFWLIGTWIAKQLNLDFYLLNLVRSEKEKDIESVFKKHVKENHQKKFARISWEDIYGYISNSNLYGRDKGVIIRYLKNKTVGYENGKLQKAFSIPNIEDGEEAEMKEEEIKLGFVVSEFHRDITYQMEILGREHADFLGASVDRTVYTPGTFDMPLAVKKMLTEGDVDAVVTLGCIIEGATEHDEMIASQLTRKIMDLSLEYDKPVALGVPGPGMTKLEAQERIDYAKRAVEAAVKMVKRLREKT